LASSLAKNIITLATSSAVQDGALIYIKAPSCTAEDVANVIIFFASDEAKAITGQIIVTDYGAML
jgi:enoyl-[acyl-carrier-protein] reductase (NADH)